MLQRIYIFNFVLSVLICISFSSCVSTKSIKYFGDLPDSASIKTIVGSNFIEPVIRPDDILSISIQTIDPATSASVNQVASMPAIGASSASAMGGQTITGFLVDKDGVVTLPMLGSIKVAGLTTFQARQEILSKSEYFFKHPTVQVRFANYKITVLGEVLRPATYTVPNEKVSILDAIGLAGDLTIYGKRENVLLIRESGSKREFIRINLNDSKFFQSSYFYLRQNDVIYVEPGKARVAANNAARTQTLAIVGSIISIIIVAVSRL